MNILLESIKYISPSLEWHVDIQQNNRTVKVPETLDVSSGDAQIFRIYSDAVVNQTIYWILSESPSGYFRVENATGCKKTRVVPIKSVTQMMQILWFWLDHKLL